MKKALLIAVWLLIAPMAVLLAADVQAGHTAYVIHDGEPLLSEKSPDASTVTKLKSHKEYDVVAISGKWAQLKVGSSTGWVYTGNLSRDEPPEVNNSVFHTDTSDTKLAAAARGLDDDAKAYAARKDASASAAQIDWLEKQNAAVTRSDVKAYLQEHHLGEYGDSK